MAKSTTTTKRGKKTGKGASESIDDDDDGEFNVEVLHREEEKWGWGKSWNPEYMQCCVRSPWGLLISLCMLILAASYIELGVVPASMTQWQRRFYFSVDDICWIRLSYEFGSLVMVIPVVLAAEESIHRAQFIGMGGVAVAFGAFLMIMPEFIVGTQYQELDSTRDLCGIATINTTERCDPKYDSMKGFFIAGQFFIGMGTTPHYIMGITFLDENVTHRQSSLFTFIVEMCQMIGPTFGFLFTSWSTRLYGDIDYKNWPNGPPIFEQGVDDEFQHHNWYGAWWIAMAFGGIFSLIGALLMFPFPNELSSRELAHIKDVQDALKEHHELLTGVPGERIDESTPSLVKWRSVIFNKVFFVALLEECIRNALLAGGMMFITKYVEAAFQVDSYSANLGIGLFVFPAALIGLGMGMFLEHVFHLDIKGNLVICIVGAVGTCFAATIFKLECEPPNIAGISGTRLYSDFPRLKANPACDMNDTDSLFNSTLLADSTPIADSTCNGSYESALNIWCNNHCQCQNVDFDPVCWRPPNYKPNTGDNRSTITYFSKCFAGCKTKELDNGTLKASGIGKSYPIITADCECLPGPGTLHKGRCEKCHPLKMWAFLLGLAWLSVTIFIRVNPTQQLLLRSVHFNLRMHAMAVTEVAIRIVAIPGTFLSAQVLINYCKLPAAMLCTKKDGTKKELCQFYNIKELNVAIMIGIIAIGVVTFLPMAMVLLRHKPPQMKAADVTSKGGRSLKEKKGGKGSDSEGASKSMIGTGKFGAKPMNESMIGGERIVEGAKSTISQLKSFADPSKREPDEKEKGKEKEVKHSPYVKFG